MDINTILPLLLGDGGKATDPMSLISMLASNANPNLAKTLSMAQSIKAAQPKRQAVGLRPIKGIACNDIIGRLTKYYT
jgi:hypothetical protein